MSGYHYNLGRYFQEVAESHGHRPALRYPERDYSYQELLRTAERLGTWLTAQGCRRGDVIAIAHTKRPLSYALMMAALRLGVAYVNLDVESPAARTLRILDVSRPHLMCYDDERYSDAMTALAAAERCPLLFLAQDRVPEVGAADLAQQQALMAGVDGSSVAYIMFTSGSTGVPKGVAVTHQNVLHFIAWGQLCFAIETQDNFANLSPMYFDNSVFDFYVALFSGACLSPIARELLTRPYELVNQVDRLGCTLWFCVPSLLIYLMAMKAMQSVALSGLRTIVFGGEGYPKIELKKLYDLFSHQARLVNVYGPTECTCICSAYTLGAHDFNDLAGLPPLGRLNPNFDYRILNAEDQDSDLGELCLIGPNVAAGYFNDEVRTASTFLTLTDSKRFMKRMYRTGDLVREDRGDLWFVGRKDNQIKHMGYRIELEEIENALVTIPQVRQAAVIYRRDHAAYGKLVGFVDCWETADSAAILSALRDLVPDYMIPSRLVAMAELPKNANGKVDRLVLKALLDDQPS
ncbi:amino acid adenylation domain-containing protein [uncultured Thiodictyon sp.]|jgi:D-alanine--poly(phosphoribitol) ligase subunit 1|uniref:amino acid adenylation domain-containing protein n=1 Tax=uncultured Thiodictyon sp. TaxID=1846217 RepID=UPI0025D32236|nr:amino acid adenylation domain-containing protein [uncultured Thiodictyon sp.]